MWCDICYLGRKDIVTDEVGDAAGAILYDKEVYCNEKSIKASEFYQAQALGMKPEVNLELMIADYNKETHVKYEGEEYRVLRTFKTSKERIELTLIRGVNNASTT